VKILLTVFALLVSGFALAKPLKAIVVFGDSLSDNGNLYEYMGYRLPQDPPYFAGRFSNGPVWVEHLVASYFPKNAKARLLDYAYGGAAVSEKEEDSALFTLRREINIYFNSHGGKADANSLFIVWIGANNFLHLPKDVEKTITEVNSGITHGLQRLAKAGAKYIMVVNAPDLGKTLLATEPADKEALSNFSRQHNELLENTIRELQQSYPRTRWLYYDVDRKLSDIVASPANYGFTNVTSTCYDLVDECEPKSVLQIAANLKLKASKDVCEGYLFFDPIHPTVLAHKIIAEDARALLDASAIEFAN
jgi:phospholipase/lecithinase/hemolysin